MTNNIHHKNDFYQKLPKNYYNMLITGRIDKDAKPVIKSVLLEQLMSRLQLGINSEQELCHQLNDEQIHDASVLLAITNEQYPKLMLTRRASHIKAHAGEVALAGGKHEDEDGNNVITALRESYEETLLHPNKTYVVGQLPSRRSKAGLSVKPIVAIVEPNQQLVPEAGEIAKIFWADLHWLIDANTQEYKVETMFNDKPTIFLTPSWQVDGETVWGLTGRIIASMLDIGFNRQLDWYYKLVE
ncbi:MAG: coenzyme A pyrophosphatase [Gammaproteobacteria bacterium]|nr:MAG: coenzyme A pyrophosphatase [Gammaproteobacteria bacterium]